jgi:lysophospholipase L1-like esterase
MPEDHRMDRFQRGRRRAFRARDALLVVGLCALLLALFEGGSVRKAGEEMNPGIGRDAVLAVGKPAAWLAGRLPLAHAGHRFTAFLSPDHNLGDNGQGFRAAQLSPGAPGSVPPVTPDAFDPSALGARNPAPRPLHTVLVTGDSMSMPLDDDLARTLDPKGIHVVEDPHVGTGISSTLLLDWGQEATAQVKSDHPDAVVVFIGANDGFSMPDPAGVQVPCCSAKWAAIYATRARLMMNTWRRAGIARVYWLTLPAPRDSTREAIAKVVDAAVEVAAQPWQDQVRIIDTVPVFTPGDRYRDAMPVNGTQTIVRQADGIHLNDAGSQVAANIVLAAITRDFKL